MNPTQLSLFGDYTDDLDVALRAVSNQGVKHAHYQSFVREVISKTLGHRMGNLILCAAPAGILADELIESVRTGLEKEYESLTGTSFPGLSIINMPSSCRRKPGAYSILESYQTSVETPGIVHRRPPQFQLEMDSAILIQNQFATISGLIQRRPSAVYVFKNAHLLRSHDSGDEKAIDALQTIAEIANNSKRTHILIGRTNVVLDWLKIGTIASATSPCLLPPYDPDIAVDRANFAAILKAYDNSLPWESGQSLIQHVDEINHVVWGCPDRLRKWIVQALCKARADRERVLTWKRMVSTRLLPAETDEAEAELRGARSFLAEPPGETASGAGPVSTPAPRGNPRPGQRNPNRNGLAA